MCDVKFGQVLQDYKSLTAASPDVIRAFLTNLEDGDLFRQMGILNLLEGDFFSWYADENQWDETIAGEVKEILETLARYEDSRSIFESARAVDLFRSLYEATVPQVVRSSLGEFYTPYWLAEHVLETSSPKGKWTVLDPCCGSGTFLLAAIARLRDETKNRAPADAAKAILERIAGIDLNPLAVLTSRIHFFIHIADYLDDLTDEITIPVYLGDASNIPTIVKRGGVQFYHYELKTLKTPLSIDIPLFMVEDLVAFGRSLFRFEQLVRSHDYESAKDSLLEAADYRNQPKVVADRIGALADQIIDLEQKNWDGIWSRIIANFIATARIGPFTNVIGNPPWIDWKSLPSGYREKVKGLCVEKGLFSGAGRTGGINLNVCALVAHVSATNWLAKGGRLAFLMPRELINQASYEGWRKAVGGENCSLVELHDWSEAGHPFDPVKEDFMTFVIEAAKRDQKTLPVTSYIKTDRRQKSHNWESLSEAQKYLEIERKVAGQVVAGASGYSIAGTRSDLSKFAKLAGECAYIGREGIEFYPQELVLFKYEGPGPKKGTVWVSNIQVSRSKYKVPKSKVPLETRYLFPLVKGPGIDRFGYDDPDIIVAFPYDSSNPHAPVTKKVLQATSPLLLAYFEKYKKLFEQQTEYSDSLRGEGEYYGLARTGPYSFQETYVAFRDNTKWRATVIDKKRMPWGEDKRYLFQNHAVSICERSKGKYTNKQEAAFIAAILNCPIVEQFIYASSDNRSFKIRPPVFVPVFDSKDPLHKNISKLGAEALRYPSRWDRLAPTVEALYLQVCENSNPRKGRTKR